MNNVTLLGRLTKDPEINYTPTGKVYARFTLAVDRVGVKGGEGVQTADFIPCVCWGQQAERLGNTVHKGQRLLVDRGSINTGTYKDKDGNTRSSFSVNVLSFTYIEKREGTGQPNFEGNGTYDKGSRSASGAAGEGNYNGGYGRIADEPMTDIPF